MIFIRISMFFMLFVLAMKNLYAAGAEMNPKEECSQKIALYQSKPKFGILQPEAIKNAWFCACQNGFWAIGQEIIENKELASTLEPRYFTLGLLDAAVSNNVEMLERILKKKHELGISTHSLWLATRLAGIIDSIDTFKFLLDFNSILYVKQEELDEIFISVITNGALKAVKYMLNTSLMSIETLESGIRCANVAANREFNNKCFASMPKSYKSKWNEIRAALAKHHKPALYEVRAREFWAHKFFN